MHGNLRVVYEALRIGQLVGWGEVHPLMAEIVVGIAPAWYVLQIVSGHERMAVAHLAGRRFGVYLPELARVPHARDKRRREPRPMFPGYIFVFAWLGGRNHERIRSCPGVWDFLRRTSGEPATLSDHALNGIRAIENRQRPLVLPQEAIGRFKKGRRGWRRFRKITEYQVEDSEIVAVHTWSALRDGKLDADGRNRLLLDALGVV